MLPRRSSVVMPVAAFLALGVALPIAVLVWLTAHHEPPYVFDRGAMESARTALGGHPLAMRPVSGVFDLLGDGGTTADYGDGRTATMVRAKRPSQVIDKYGLSLAEKRSTSFTVGGFTQRDASLADGRFARTFGSGGTVFAFVAPSLPALDELVAQSAVRPNSQRGIGNTVFDEHGSTALVVGLVWLAGSGLLAGRAILRP